MGELQLVCYTWCVRDFTWNPLELKLLELFIVCAPFLTNQICYNNRNKNLVYISMSVGLQLQRAKHFSENRNDESKSCECVVKLFHEITKELDAMISDCHIKLLVRMMPTLP